MAIRQFHEQLLRLEREAILPVKWGLLLLCVALAILTSPGYVPRPALFACLLVFACLNFLFTYAILRIPELVRYAQLYSVISYSADVLIICALIFITGGITSQYYILFFLVIFRGSGIFPTVRSTLIADLFAAVGYMITLVLARGELSVIVEQDFVVRFGLLWGVVLLGWLMVHVMTRQKDDYLTAISELQLRNEFVHNLLQSMSEGLVVTDGAGRVTLVNQAARRILGLGDRNIEGEDVYLVSAPLATVIEHARASDERAAEATVRLSEDDTQPLEVLASARALEPHSAAPDQPGAVCVFRDMSLVRRLETGLIRSEKLASVGELAAGLAHELGNPLAIIKSCVDFVHQSGPADAAEELDIISAEVERCRAIVTQLLTLSRPHGKDRAVLDLCPVLRNTCELVRLQKGSEHIVVVDKIGSEPIMVLASPSELSSVFTNILVNAVQAMGGNGTITVSSGFADSGGRQWGVVEISDTGCGIAPTDLEHIFEPFYTRREGGTGLGLSIVARILDQLGAVPEVRSTPGVGTTFRLLFPLARARRRSASGAAQNTPSQEVP